MNYIETLAIDTWELGELRNLHQRDFHLRKPNKELSQRTLIDTILDAADESVLEGAFAKGNHKTGPGIRQWNLPPMVTCPGSSTECTLLLPDGRTREKPRCWACRNAYNLPTARVRYKLNLAWSRRPDFVPCAVQKIRKERMQIVRVPSTGDLYDAAYINKWAEIASELIDDGVIFYGYTRSWWAGHQEGNFYLQPALVRLAEVPNFRLWWSLDRSMAPAAIPKGVGRTCYMSCDDHDLPPPGVKVTLVFRDLPGHKYGPDRTGKRKYSPRKTMHGVTVCPVEDGKTKGMTCTKCGLCWK